MKRVVGALGCVIAIVAAGSAAELPPMERQVAEAVKSPEITVVQQLIRDSADKWDR